RRHCPLALPGDQRDGRGEKDPNALGRLAQPGEKGVEKRARLVGIDPVEEREIELFESVHPFPSGPAPAATLAPFAAGGRIAPWRRFDSKVRTITCAPPAPWSPKGPAESAPERSPASISARSLRTRASSWRRT